VIALSTELHPNDFMLTASGECRLNPQLARRIVESSMNVVPEEIR